MKFEGTKVFGLENTLVGMRLPMNKNYEEAQSKCDSVIEHNVDHEFDNNVKVGEKDLDLMKRLIKADVSGGVGQPNSKFLRMIHVQVAITAPTYFMAELDTYKIGTTRNSTSMQHKGTAYPYTIDSFEVSDDIKEVLRIKEKEYAPLSYPYETDEYKIYTCENGRQYKVYKNGRIFACEFEYTDSWGSGRTRHFEEREIIPSLTRDGYYEIRIGGRNGERWGIHRLVATVWLNNPNNYKTVDHLNMNKGDNSVENLEWVSLEENIKREWENHKGFDLQKAYKNWKYSSKVNPYERAKIRELYSQGKSRKELQEMFNLSYSTVYVIIKDENSTSENRELFEHCWYWEQTIDNLNMLREKYLDTKDYKYFRLIRQLMPMSYLYTSMWDADYATLRNIYKWRKNHKLTEWHSFCDWIETLPYAKELIC